MNDEADNEKQLREWVQTFRESWSLRSAPDYEHFLNRVSGDRRLRLLVQLIQVDMELSILRTTREYSSRDIHEDDCRVEPRLELFLLRFPEIRSSFEASRDLVVFEFAIRRSTSKPLEIQHYLEILPEYAHVFRGLLTRIEDQLVTTSMIPERFGPSRPEDSTVPDTSGQPLQAWRLPKQLGTFQLLSLIGRGGMGTVFRALDLRTGGVCAVKVMRRIDSWSVYRFNEEFRALASLEHPNIARLYESFSDEGVRYFSMEIVNGHPLDVWWSRIASEHRWEVLKQVLSQVAIGMQFLHHRGITHGDIKPANILVTKRGRAVLLDLGLATFAIDVEDSQLRRSDRVVGTLSYMAPEVARGERISCSSDWYSFGAILHELLYGKSLSSPNAPSTDPKDVQPSLPLVSFREGPKYAPFFHQERIHDDETIPTELVDLCCALTSSDPSQRWDASQVVEALRSHTLPTTVFVHAFEPVALVGREDALKSLDQALRHNESGASGCLVTIHGEKGIGKSRFLHEWFRLRGRRPHELILRAVCSPKDASPFRLINSLVQSLVSQWFLQNLALLPSISNHTEIARGFPQFSQILNQRDEEVSHPRVLDELILRNSAAQFVALLAQLSQSYSILISIDNAQWADATSIECMLGLWKVATPFQGAAIALCRGDGQEGLLGPEMGQYCIQVLANSPRPPKMEVITLRNLPHKEGEKLASLLLTRQGMPVRSTSELTLALAQIGQGNPNLMEELVQSLYEADPTGESWGMKLVELQGLDTDQFRFQRLKPEAKQIVEFVAVARSPVSFQQLQIATRVGPDLLLPYLGELAANNWVTWRGLWPDLKLTISSSLLRDKVVGWTDEERLKRRHARLAQSLVLEVDKKWDEIAHHYQNAGKERRAINAHLEAAQQFVSINAMDLAKTHLERARSIMAFNREQERIAMEIAKRLQSSSWRDR